MNAQQLTSILSFVPGKPMLVLRDGAAGIIKVFIKGKHAMSIVPAFAEEPFEAVLVLKESCDAEFCGSYTLISTLLSYFQQHEEFPEDMDELDPLGLLRWPA